MFGRKIAYMIILALPPSGHTGEASMTSPYAPIGTRQVDSSIAALGRAVLGLLQEASRKKESSPACAIAWEGRTSMMRKEHMLRAFLRRIILFKLSAFKEFRTRHLGKSKERKTRLNREIDPIFKTHTLSLKSILIRWLVPWLQTGNKRSRS